MGAHAQRAFGWLLSIGIASTTASAWSQAYPSKPIIVIAPYGAGASSDTANRLVTSKVNERRGWNMIVENRPGADGIIGIEAVLREPADGYTILQAISSYAILPTSKKGKLPYDPLADLMPLTRFLTFQSVLYAGSTFPPNTLNELVAYSKARPGQLNYATNGHGASGHLLGELLKAETGLDMANVAYKGGPQRNIDVMNGSVQLSIATAAEVVTLAKAGKLKVIATVSNRRAPLLPDVPSVAETLPRFSGINADTWLGYMLRAGTPPSIHARLHSEITAVLRLPEIRQKIVELGGTPVDESAEAFRTTYLADIARWEKVIRDANIKFE